MNFAIHRLTLYLKNVLVVWNCHEGGSCVIKDIQKSLQWVVQDFQILGIFYRSRVSVIGLFYKNFFWASWALCPAIILIFVYQIYLQPILSDYFKTFKGDTYTRRINFYSVSCRSCSDIKSYNSFVWNPCFTYLSSFY